jgi:hypothetical protein
MSITAEGTLEIGKTITFNELIKHGVESGANIVDGMPWSWKINGYAITHENGYCYLIQTITGIEKMYPDSKLEARENGLWVWKNFPYETHAPGGCPL